MSPIIQEINMARLVGNLIVKVRFARTTRIRVWIATQIIGLAGLIAGFNVEIEQPDSLEGIVTTRG